MYKCDVCGKSFSCKLQIRQHSRGTGHSACKTCGKILISSKALEQHNRAVHSWKCPQCPAKLASKQALANHQRKLSHCYCGDCNRAFRDASALAMHLQSSRHSTEFRCCDCDRSFVNSEALEQHLRKNTHKQNITAHKCRRCHRRFKCRGALLQHAEAHQTSPKGSCQKCTRKFQNLAALQQHIESAFHNPLGNLQCIAGASCGKTFSSPSSLLHHLESGACSSGMTRAALNGIIVAHDKDRLITKAETSMQGMLMEVNKRLDLTGRKEGSSSSATSGTLVPTPTSDMVSSFAFTPDSLASNGQISDWFMIVSETSSNRCPLCPLTRRPFHTKMALRHHLHSAAHSEPIFFCPKPLFAGQTSKDLRRAFKTASGLAQHLESRACIGGADGFLKVVRYLEIQFQRLGLNVGLATLDATPTVQSWE